MEHLPSSAVFYCSGRYEANRTVEYNHLNNIGGIGIHGYFYLNEVPRKGSGHTTSVPTASGYVQKSELSDPSLVVTPVHYVDVTKGIGSWLSFSSVPQAELQALIHTLELILESAPQLTSVTIVTASKYVATGSTKGIAKWEAAGWRTATGNEVRYRSMWEKVKLLLERIKSSNIVDFNITQVLEHTVNAGLDTSFMLASKALASAVNQDEEMHIYLNEAQGYWKNENESPRILQAARWYLSTTDHDYVDDKGRHVYYVGTHGTKDKEVELVGKRYADNFLGVVKIGDADPVMEDLRKQYLSDSVEDLSHILITHLDVLFSPKQYLELKNRGYKYTINRIGKMVKTTDTGVIISNAMDPMGLGFRMVSVWTNLRRTLEQYNLGEVGYQKLCLLDTFFDRHPKKDEYKLKPSFTQMVKYIDIPAIYNLAKIKDEADLKTRKTRLILGSDMLSRNQLAAIAPDIVRFELLTWRESSAVGRYATYVELKNGDHGIWCRYDSNVAIFKE